jgi:hypothetical protein
VFCCVEVTHLVALSSMGDKYKYATTFSIPVLTEDWLQAAWDNRHNIGYRSVIKLFLPAFFTFKPVLLIRIRDPVPF